MKKIISQFMLPMFALFCVTSEPSIAADSSKAAATGTLETLIVASGNVSLELDLNGLNGVAGKGSKLETLRFEAMKDSFLPFLVLNGELRGPRPGVIALVTTDAPSLPAQLSEALPRLVLEKGAGEQAYDLSVRDGKTGFVYFNIEGHQYDYDAKAKTLRIADETPAYFGWFCEEHGTSRGRRRDCGKDLAHGQSSGDGSRAGCQWRSRAPQLFSRCFSSAACCYFLCCFAEPRRV